ncbi:histidinol-phosphate aminotransferase [Paenibacillus baekrokdamisoli]|uniref:Histidinol-phosphate aminotransferase n=1 Tax=Paenibacillus baekrokdamisoli TaxID=1712516 RepID=A0A3G9JDB8_9BACL|nr:histidinol-phosphate transaminase [Paenibacillus baekrokdamisoli]MBB3069667.1 histidinol-phosphate aminotransferase [Paenibacillus baekrokdamisoli]BBH20979.1 histidinol-phosphate aminotransferase [Paenibacillus baekrokdamisoli]
MIPKKSIVHLPVYQPGKPVEEVKRELGLKEVIKLASNENPFGSSEHAKAAIQNEIANISIYPDGGSVQLTAAVAEYLEVNPNQIIFGAGSDEVILMLARAFLSPGDETIMADETFPQYKHNAEIEGATVIEVPLKEGTHDLPAILSKINERTKIVWICNPNNPSGTIVREDELAAFVREVPKHVLIVLDEAYYEYVTDEAYPNSLALLRDNNNVILLRTFSKIYGLASLRIGYGVGHPDVVRSINQVREPFNTTRFAQAAATASIKDIDFLNSCKERNAEGRIYLTEQFARLGLSHFEAHGNFVMVDVKLPSQQVFDGLLRRGIISRARWTYYPTHIRITVGSQAQNESFIKALEEVLSEAAVLG